MSLARNQYTCHLSSMGHPKGHQVTFDEGSMHIYYVYILSKLEFNAGDLQ